MIPFLQCRHTTVQVKTMVPLLQSRHTLLCRWRQWFLCFSVDTLMYKWRQCFDWLHNMLARSPAQSNIRTWFHTIVICFSVHSYFLCYSAEWKRYNQYFLSVWHEDMDDSNILVFSAAYHVWHLCATNIVDTATTNPLLPLKVPHSYGQYQQHWNCWSALAMVQCLMTRRF